MKQIKKTIQTMLIAFLTLILIQNAFSSNTELEAKLALDNYYQAFANEDIDKIMGMKYLSQDSSEYEGVKKLTQKQFDEMDILSYSLSNVKAETYKNAAIIEYFLDMKIGYEQGTLLVDEEMKAILIKTDSRWKIFMVAEKEIIDRMMLQVNLEKGLQTYEIEQEATEPKPEPITNGCGDNICDIGESCIADCGFEPWTKTCGNGICEENEDCAYDCNNLETIDFRTGTQNTYKCKLIFNINEIDNKNLNDYNINVPSWLKDQVLTDKKIKLKLDSKEYNFKIENDTISILENLEDYDYLITTDSCTINSIINQDLTFDEAYNQEKITLETKGASNTIKTWIGKLFYSIYSLFNPSPVKIIIEAEDGTLKNPGRYSFIGATSRGPGELYLGTGGSYAEYEINNTIDGTAYIYFMFSDDAKHRDGTRDANFYFNNQKLEFKHKSINTLDIPSGKYWDRVYLGEIELKKGPLKIKIEKPKQTSAAFVMDKMIISDTKLE